MMDKNDSTRQNDFDPLDMHNYRIEKLPKRSKSSVEKFLATLGSPLAVLGFVLIYFVLRPDYLINIEPETLGSFARNIYEKVGAVEFSRMNIAMMAIFVAAVILWMTEALPNYLTSLIAIIALVLTGVLTEREAYAQLGHPVMWLNIMSFVLASMLVKTGLAKRFALWFIVHFGKHASSIFLSFLFINVVLSAFISATTAKAAILLPIFMVIAAIYGARGGDKKNNFGRNIVLQNLFYINIGASGFMTGSGANLLAVALITGATGSTIFFADWMKANFVVAILLMFIGYLVATRIFFPLKKEERIPQIEGGMKRLRDELHKLGKLNFQEIKSGVLFIAILAFWSTDRYHGISPTAIAFIGAIIALLPRIGILKWNDVDIPWHLMLFSAGAYTLGAGFKVTDLPSISVNAIFNGLGFGENTPFWVLYLSLTFAMAFSALFFQSKTMRTMIFIPIAIGVANRFGFSVISLALPVAFLIEHVYMLPFNSKPAALLYETDQYSLTDTFKFGFSMLVIGWLVNILMGETWYRYLDITPNGVFGVF
ncbi:MAG: SLC13 family permease [Bacteroidales bacterium]|jgi:anion transporter|nr:SLC13 family permease [Bacteroidales bacterium]MDD2633382.1 SLC13 family permease [Bacteroidales bacterium]MDD3130558.1 SLC13 family permease [Bacteroidales bacterium]MDD4178041.1 SLC13 family permease [Bacteroidales bacterium]MDY0334968.1 SLC13 family permease [Bacteroidales bacterium]